MQTLVRNKFGETQANMFKLLPEVEEAHQVSLFEDVPNGPYTLVEERLQNHNLPRPAPFFGREKEQTRESLCGILHAASLLVLHALYYAMLCCLAPVCSDLIKILLKAKLVCALVSGEYGMGKTALALKVAHYLANGTSKYTAIQYISLSREIDPLLQNLRSRFACPTVGEDSQLVERVVDQVSRRATTMQSTTAEP